jgi:hypothetical protein
MFKSKKYLSIKKAFAFLILVIMTVSLEGQNNFLIAKNIQSKIIEKNKGIINVSWRYRLKNSSYSDSMVEFNKLYYNSNINELFSTYDFIDIDTNYLSILVAKKDKYYTIEEDPKLINCKEKTDLVFFKKNWSKDFLHLSHPLARKITYDTNSYSYKVIQKKAGDSIYITKKDKNVAYKLFVDSNSRIRFYQEIIYFEAAEFPITQTVTFDSFYYSDSIIDIEPYLKLKTCPPVPKKKPSKVKEPTLDEMFLNKRFDFKPFVKYIDSNLILNSGKITVLDFSFLSCFGCVLLLKSYEKILDSFSNQMDVILIDPVDPRGKNLIINKTLKDNNIYERIKYYITFDDAYETTFNNKIKAYPTLFFLDKNGIVRLIKIGVQIDENIYETFKKEIERITELNP